MAGKKRRFAPNAPSGSLCNGTSTGTPRALGSVATPSHAFATKSSADPFSDGKALEFLIGSEDLLNFQTKTWERHARLFAGKKSASRTDYFRNLCNLSVFQEHIEEAGAPLEFGVDLNATRYVDGVKETANGQVADAQAIQELWQEGCTLQVVQPQRWEPRLMALVAALERQLGCLVGVNAYLTPPGTQGLAPHHDAVELFVCQTSGSKSWRLYRPVNGHSLPALPSGDLEPASLGEPIAEVTLQVGDVLYLPKGTVHQAVATPGSSGTRGGKRQKRSAHATAGDGEPADVPPHSAHLTLSTFNRWSHADLLATVLRVAEAGSAERESSLPLRLRRGLPFDFLAKHGLQASLVRTKNGVTSAASALASGLRKLAADIEERPDLVDAAADDMAQGFLRTRAPPLAGGSAPDKGKSPTQMSRVFAAAPGCFRLVGCSEEEMLEAGGDDSDIDGSGFVRLVSCLHNLSRNHMMAPSAGDADSVPDMGAGESYHGRHGHQHGDDCSASGCKHGSHPGPKSGSSSSSSDGGSDNGRNCEGDNDRDTDNEGDRDGSLSDEESEVDELVLPAAHAAAAATLLHAPKSKPLAVKAVLLPTLEERLTLAHALWDIGAIKVAE